jgi:hypothetical protein
MKIYPLVLLFVINNVYAQFWEYITTSKSGTAYFIDNNSIVKKGEIVSYVQLLNYPDGYDSKNREIHSIQHAKQIDCERNLSKTLSMIAYDKENATGKIQTLFVSQEVEWEKINANSILSIYKNEACK